MTSDMWALRGAVTDQDSTHAKDMIQILQQAKQEVPDFLHTLQQKADKAPRKGKGSNSRYMNTCTTQFCQAYVVKHAYKTCVTSNGSKLG